MVNQMGNQNYVVGPLEGSFLTPAVPALAVPVLALLVRDSCGRATVQPSLTAKIDGVEIDFCRVSIRGVSHLLTSPSLDARGFMAAAGTNCNHRPIDSDKCNNLSSTFS